MDKADIIKVLWNKKCYKDARRQKINKNKKSNEKENGRTKAYLSGKSGRASWGTMDEVLFKIGVRDGNYLNWQRQENSLSRRNVWRKWKGGRI